MAHDVFISYSVEDKPTADGVCAILEARRVRCWIAPRDVLPGEDYAEALVGAIDGSRLMVLVFSSYSNTSPHVMREVERAASRGIPILPLRIEDVIPSKSMAYFISRTHWLDALTPPLRKHLQRLAETVTMLLARSGETAPLAEEAMVPAPPADEATSETELARPRLLRRAQEVAKSWSSRPLVRFVLGIGGIAAVVVIVLAVLLFGGGEGDSRDENLRAAAAPTAVPTATATVTPMAGLPITGEGPTGSPET
ncbi:MAG: TIR domain-containing protein, partial [Anaerolineae bacterium]|nr:TIR domain-containing protein [Anaerolineae bacterium]NIN99286.1 TIR domain-containing protein [Anaerolineae bacterium]NIQ82124.1 TIR domain-containing protein [Anaerolineae bacterium]